jgi:hypothetical protein
MAKDELRTACKALGIASSSLTTKGYELCRVSPRLRRIPNR